MTQLQLFHTKPLSRDIIVVHEKKEQYLTTYDVILRREIPNSELITRCSNRTLSFDSKPGPRRHKGGRVFQIGKQKKVIVYEN